MRVKWEKLGPWTFEARIGKDTLNVRRVFGRGPWIAKVYDADDTMFARRNELLSERAAKREAVRMWRALRGAK